MLLLLLCCAAVLPPPAQDDCHWAEYVAPRQPQVQQDAAEKYPRIEISSLTAEVEQQQSILPITS
jgi:hypothetical protein